MSYVLSADLSPEDGAALYEKLVADVAAQVEGLPKKFSKDSATEENKDGLFAALKRARVLAWIALGYGGDAAAEIMPEQLAALRDSALSFLRYSKKDNALIKEELAGMVSFGFPFLVQNSYQSIRISQDLAMAVYAARPTPLSALVLGVNYLNSANNKYGQQVFNAAEAYLEDAVALDAANGSYAYLGNVYLAVLYYKTRRTDKARASLVKAAQIFPDGPFVYVVHNFYFANGIHLFQKSSNE